MIKVIIVGYSGRMGQAIAKLLQNDPQTKLVAGVDTINGRGNPAGSAALPPPMPRALRSAPTAEILITDRLEDVIHQADVIIDFSSPSASLKTSEMAASHHKAMVMGTTGFAGKELEQLQHNLKKIPSVFSPNMSLGVNVLLQLVRQATQALGQNFDIEIVEAHHRLKKDAPSGTALKIADVIADTMKKDLSDIACYERHGITGERPHGQLGIQTLRGGDIVGTHSILYAGTGEVLEITHRATSRDTFASGAIHAAKWIANKKPGIYTMSDVLGLA